jgi:hypothetical protein
MHVQEVAFSVRSRQLTQKIPTIRITRVLMVLDLPSRPKDGPLGTTAKAIRIEQRCLIVVAKHAHIDVHDAVDAFARVGAVAHDVTQAIYAFGSLLAYVSQNRVQGR